jgi:thiamine-monophosphate kinase
MKARSRGYLLRCCFPKHHFCVAASLPRPQADQKTFGVSLYGGDMSATRGLLSVSITAFGHVPRGRAILRGGAKPGDIVS